MKYNVYIDNFIETEHIEALYNGSNFGKGV